MDVDILNRCHRADRMSAAEYKLLIVKYILDRRKSGIECHEEGAMRRLFHAVNSLAAIADSHADGERQSKEFLRNTISDISHQLKTPIAALRDEYLFPFYFSCC